MMYKTLIMTILFIVVSLIRKYLHDYLFNRRKEIKASSVAELCDLSHHDDILTSSITPTYANTMTSPQGTSHYPNSVRGQSCVNTTTDGGQGGTLNRDVPGVSHDQSSQDAVDQRKMMKQVSTSSIQVGEGMFVPPL